MIVAIGHLKVIENHKENDNFPTIVAGFQFNNEYFPMIVANCHLKVVVNHEENDKFHLTVIDFQFSNDYFPTIVSNCHLKAGENPKENDNFYLVVVDIFVLDGSERFFDAFGKRLGIDFKRIKLFQKT